MADLILIEMAEGILTLTINRPEKEGAVTNEMYTGLCRGLLRRRELPKLR